MLNSPLNFRNHPITYLVLFIFLLSSCVTQRRLEYLQIKNKQPKEFTNESSYEYKLKPKDELYIQISSPDDATFTLSSSSNSGRSELGSMSPYSASLVSYPIDNDGYLEYPVIGKILVKDKTITQLKTMIKDA